MADNYEDDLEQRLDVFHEGSLGEEQARQKRMRKQMQANALRKNRIPVVCEDCGGEVVQKEDGRYFCKKCGKEHFDDFGKIRNYLEKAGPRPAMVIARNTGVPIRSVNRFLEEEYLEVPEGSEITLTCERCGAKIRTGRLCDSCKKLDALGDKKLGILNPEKQKGSWHSGIRRK